jgi:hypothetical protein
MMMKEMVEQRRWMTECHVVISLVSEDAFTRGYIQTGLETGLASLNQLLIFNLFERLFLSVKMPFETFVCFKFSPICKASAPAFVHKSRMQLKVYARGTLPHPRQLRRSPAKKKR